MGLAGLDKDGHFLDHECNVGNGRGRVILQLRGYVDLHD